MQVKALAAKHDNLSLTPRTHIHILSPGLLATYCRRLEEGTLGSHNHQVAELLF